MEKSPSGLSSSIGSKTYWHLKNHAVQHGHAFGDGNDFRYFCTAACFISIVSVNPLRSVHSVPSPA